MLTVSRSLWTVVRRPVTVVAAALVSAGALGVLGAGASTTPGTPAQVAALVKASVNIKTVNSTVAGELPGAPMDIADVIYKIPALCVTATACVYGDTSSSKTIVLFGNSHARMWLPAIDPIATSDGYKLVLLGKNACPVVTLNLNPTTYPQCNSVIAESIAVINAIKPAVAVLSDRTVEPGYTAAKWESGMEATLKAIKASVNQTVIVGDIQEFSFNPDTCLSTHPTKVQTDCSMANPNPKEKTLASAELAAAKAEKVNYVNPVPWLCTTKRCSSVIGNFVGYWDSDHVTVNYAAYLATVMGDALQPIITKS